jgi:glycosyltransferase involved in cell wall biosynthesis
MGRSKQNVLRVVHTVLQLDTGGMERLLVEFARHADRSRFDLHFVSLSSRGRVADEIEAIGWPVTALRVPQGLRPGMVLKLTSLFRRVGADVVHAHNTKPLIYSGPAARLARVPAFVYTRHGQRTNARRGENILYRMAVRTADRAVTVSDDGARLAVKDGLDPKRVRRIWNGIDTGRFAFAGSAPGGPAVMVGRLSPEKDVQNLLRAVEIVVRAQPRFRLEVAGDGVCLPELRELSSRLGLSPSVRFLGEVRDVPALLARASMCVLPSLTEGVSLTLLEAMARGLPVVATRVGGNPEVVADGETGLLVPSAQPERLADAIVQLYNDPARGSEMGRAGRRRVETNFDVRQMVASYEALYDQVLEKSGDAERRTTHRAGRVGAAAPSDATVTLT